MYLTFSLCSVFSLIWIEIRKLFHYFIYYDCRIPLISYYSIIKSWMLHVNSMCNFRCFIVMILSNFYFQCNVFFYFIRWPYRFRLSTSLAHANRKFYQDPFFIQPNSCHTILHIQNCNNYSKYKECAIQSELRFHYSSLYFLFLNRISRQHWEGLL